MGIIILFFSIGAGVVVGLVVGVIALLLQSDAKRRGGSFFIGFLLGGFLGFGAMFAYIIFVALKDWNG